MQKVTIVAAVSLIALAFVVPPAHAGGCGVVTNVGDTLYIDDRSEGAGDINHWFYLESNGVSDLQTGGANPVLPDEAVAFGFFDTCFTHGAEGPDLLLL